MNVLVTGGAGYVGSVIVEELLNSGTGKVTVLDNLSSGHSAAVSDPAELVVGDIADRDLVAKICRDDRIDTVIHMAASSLVGQSVIDPRKYYENNLTKGLALLDALIASKVHRLVFSSTAAVYGEPETSPITEDVKQAPTNPYGETKLAFERALKWYAGAYGLRSASLRYFNAAGATSRNGEQHAPETHLIPLVLDVAAGRRPRISIFGNTYPTFDGTCIRDYIHVSDLARAHVAAIQALESKQTTIYNLGCGQGYSVKEVIATAEAVTGRPIHTELGPRRAGDPAVLVASAELIRHDLGWEPKAGLRDIVSDAWTWRLRYPDGYVHG